MIRNTSGGTVKNKIISNEELPEELDKPIINKIEEKNALARYIDNIWNTDLEDMQLITKFNKGFRFSLCVIDIFSKCSWVIPLKDQKGITITNAFQKILDESNRKPTKMWADKSSKLCNRSLKSYLQKKG